MTLKAFLLQVLSPTGSCKEAVSHILTERLSSGHEANSMNTGPYCKARQRLSLSHLKKALIFCLQIDTSQLCHYGDDDRDTPGFRQRANVKSDFRKGQRLGSKDHRIEVKKPVRKPVWMTAKAYAELPNKIIIREFAVKGIVYVTTLFDAKCYPKTELAKLYQQRWEVEPKAFPLIMKPRSDYISS